MTGFGDNWQKVESDVPGVLNGQKVNSRGMKREKHPKSLILSPICRQLSPKIQVFSCRYSPNLAERKSPQSLILCRSLEISEGRP